jgi:hypothetical protein
VVLSPGSDLKEGSRTKVHLGFASYRFKIDIDIFTPRGPGHSSSGHEFHLFFISVSECERGVFKHFFDLLKHQVYGNIGFMLGSSLRRKNIEAARQVSFERRIASHG